MGTCQKRKNKRLSSHESCEARMSPCTVKKKFEAELAHGDTLSPVPGWREARLSSVWAAWGQKQKGKKTIKTIFLWRPDGVWKRRNFQTERDSEANRLHPFPGCVCVFEGGEGGYVFRLECLTVCLTLYLCFVYVCVSQLHLEHTYPFADTMNMYM